MRSNSEQAQSFDDDRVVQKKKSGCRGIRVGYVAGLELVGGLL